METKKIRKLTLNKEVVATLNEQEMNQFKGGYGVYGDTYLLITSKQYGMAWCGSVANPFVCPNGPSVSCNCPTNGCNTNILGDCLTQDYEICRTK